MKHLRLLSSFLLLALILTIVPATLAQDSTFGLSPEDFQALMDASAATASATSGQFTFTLDLSADAEGDAMDLNLTGNGLFGTDDAGSPIFQLQLGGSATAEGETTPLNLEIRLVGESLYLQAPDFMGPQWLSLSSAEMDMMMESLPVNPDELASGDLSGLEGMEGMEGMGEMMTALASLQPEQYILMSRDGDRFNTSIDLVGLLSSEAFQDLLVTAAQQEGTMEMSEEEFRAQLTQLPAALAGSSLNFDQYVTDGMVNRMVLDANLSLDPTAVGETGEPVTIDLSFDLNLSGFNQSYSVEAPADAVPLSQAFGGGGF